VILVWSILPSVNALLGTGLALFFSPGAIAFAVGVAVVTGLIAGIYPAWVLSSLAPMAMLKGGMSGLAGRRSSVLRRTFVIAQFSFSIFIITCVVVIRDQLHFMQYTDLGFNKEQVLMVRTNGQVRGKVPFLKQELLKRPAVAGVAVSATNLTSFVGSGTGPVEWEGKNTDKPLEVGFNFVDEDFAKTLQIKIVQGRFFSKDFPSDASDAFVVNEEAVREMQLMDPIGKRLTTWFGRSGRIVGVIGDYHSESLRQELAPLVLVPTPASSFLCVRLAPGDVPGALRSVEATIKATVSDDPFEYSFLDAEIDHLYKAEQTTRDLATVIAVLAIFLSCLGLLGLVSFATEQRTKEIGIRRVVGASVSGILVMLTRDYVRWVVIANIVAWPAAYFATRAWLEDFAYRIGLTLWPFLTAGLLALVIAIAVVCVQALRAATANPVVALRHE
jgi:putative ABC transport system permease protein